VDHESRRTRSIRHGLVATLLLVACLLFGAPPASAHGGPIALEIGGDGRQGVTAVATYVGDKHMVTGQVDLTMTATAPDGRAFGPVRLIASAEGQAFYTAEQPLPPGPWTVTVVATKPSAAQRTADIVSVAAPPVTALPAGPNIAVFVGIPAGLAALCGFVFLGMLLHRRTRQSGISN
jgi:hypothetical protein